MSRIGPGSGSLYVPKEGQDFNPLTKGSIRNFPCVCGSGKKIKKCCGTDRSAPKKLAAELRHIVRSQDESLIHALAEHNSNKNQGEIKDGDTN